MWIPPVLHVLPMNRPGMLDPLIMADSLLISHSVGFASLLFPLSCVFGYTAAY